MSSLIQVRAESTPKDLLMSTQKLLNMATKQSEPKFTNTENRVGTLFKENAYFYQLNDNLDAYKYTGEFTICFWVKFKDLGKTDEAYGNKITLVLNDGTTISADIPTNVVMTDYHWVKIQRDSNNLITISLDNSAIKTETSNAVFSLADNSYIFVGNTNRYFTGYEVIVDDILIFGGASPAVKNTPNGYLNPASFTMLLYIKVSDGSVWGYADDGTGGLINQDAFSDLTNIVLPNSSQIVQYISATESGAYELYSDSVTYKSTPVTQPITSGQISGLYSMRVNGTDFIKLVDRYINIEPNSTNEFTIAFWSYSGSRQLHFDNATYGSFVDRLENWLQYGFEGSYVYNQSRGSDWKYVALCRDSSGIYYLYDNGELVHSRTYLNKQFVVDTIWSNGSTYINSVLMTNNLMFTGNFTPPTGETLLIE